MYQKGLSVKSLYNMYNEDVPEVDFTDDMQRGEVWSNTRKSLYIHSILLKITDAQSPFIAGVRELPNGNTLLKIFDGKQRGTTLIHYINGDFALTGLTNEPDIYLNGEPVKLQGKRFKQLPQKLQSWILDTTLNISIMENATPEQEALIFRRLNNGKSMSRFDIARSYKKGMEDIRELTNHELFNVMLSSHERKALKQQEVIVKSWVALFEEEPNLTPAHINEVMKMLSIGTDEQEELKTSYDFIFETYKILNIKKENSEAVKIRYPRPVCKMGRNLLWKYASRVCLISKRAYNQPIRNKGKTIDHRKINQYIPRKIINHNLKNNRHPFKSDGYFFSRKTSIIYPIEKVYNIF